MSVDRSRPNPNRQYSGGPPSWLLALVCVVAAASAGAICGIALDSVEIGFTAAAIVLSVVRDLLPR